MQEPWLCLGPKMYLTLTPPPPPQYDCPVVEAILDYAKANLVMFNIFIKVRTAVGSVFSKLVLLKVTNIFVAPTFCNFDKK